MRILGQDGDGYELSVRLENAGVWREWLGAASYAKMLHHLASPAAWHSLMNSSSAAHLTLQMRVRTLLFDKASGCMFSESAEAVSPGSLNPSYLQLDVNGLYFSLDQDAEDWKRLRAEGSPALSSILVKHGLDPLSNCSSYAEDSIEIKGVGATPQHKNPPQASYSYPNLSYAKQEISKPSLNKVKKVEAWENSDGAKRPMDLVGTINKKLRSPKVSNKASHQVDPNIGPSHRDHHSDKMLNSKSSSGSMTIQEEPKGRAAHAEVNNSSKLWYDQCQEKHMVERMHRLAHRTAQCKLPFKEREASCRTPQGMAAYIDSHARRDENLSVFPPRGGSIVSNCSNVKATTEESSKWRKDIMLLPENRFPANIVPDNPVAAKRRKLESPDVEYMGLLDKLQPAQKDAIVAGRGALGSLGNEKHGPQRETNLTLKHGIVVSTSPCKPRSCLNRVQENDIQQMIHRTIAKIVAGAGFEGLKKTSLDIFSDILDHRLQKLGTGLKLLIDSYRKNHTQAEVLRMFMLLAGTSVEEMTEHVRLGMQQSLPMATQKRGPLTTQVQSQQTLIVQQVGVRQGHELAGGLQQSQQVISEKLQQTTQQAFTDKALKRRQPSNLGRSKRVEKERSISDGKPVGDVSRGMGEMKSMQMMSGGGQLHPQQSWHPQIPLQSQSAQGLQHMKQHGSSLQQQ